MTSSGEKQLNKALRTLPTTSSWTTNSVGELICFACSDEASGKHYGGITCNSCKIFFRRTVRNKLEYECRKRKECLINKETRANCRYCRFKKCLKAGMQIKAVQNDKIGFCKRGRPKFGSMENQLSTAAYISNDKVSNKSTLKVLFNKTATDNAQWRSIEELFLNLQYAEQLTSQLLPSVLAQVQQNEGGKLMTPATTETMFHLMVDINTQLMLAVDWANTLSPFAKLPTDDQKSLLGNFCGQHVMLNLAFQSRHEKDHNCLLLSSGRRLPRHHCSVTSFDTGTVNLIVEQLVQPMQFYGLDLTEYLIVKACALFNPLFVNGGINGAAAARIYQIRRQLCAALEQYTNDKQPDCFGRDKDLILAFMGPLKDICARQADDIRVIKLAGLVEIDKMMEELYLG